MNWRGAIAACALALALIAPAAADDADVVGAWYKALEKPDRAAVDALLAPDATIVLNDLGVTQTKAEFLDAFSEWEATISEGGSIRHRPDGPGYVVCYDFIDSKVLLRETFKIADGAISESVQDKLADDCKAF